MAFVVYDLKSLNEYRLQVERCLQIHSKMLRKCDLTPEV